MALLLLVALFPQGTVNYIVPERNWVTVEGLNTELKEEPRGMGKVQYRREELPLLMGTQVILMRISETYKVNINEVVRKPSLMADLRQFLLMSRCSLLFIITGFNLMNILALKQLDGIFNFSFKICDSPLLSRKYDTIGESLSRVSSFTNENQTCEMRTVSI